MIKLYPIRFKAYIKILHIHTGFNDRCLFWYNGYTGKLMDLFFIKIN